MLEEGDALGLIWIWNPWNWPLAVVVKDTAPGQAYGLGP